MRMANYFLSAPNSPNLCLAHISPLVRKCTVRSSDVFQGTHAWLWCAGQCSVLQEKGIEVTELPLVLGPGSLAPPTGTRVSYSFSRLADSLELRLSSPLCSLQNFSPFLENENNVDFPLAVFCYPCYSWGYRSPTSRNSVSHYLHLDLPGPKGTKVKWQNVLTYLVHNDEVRQFTEKLNY